MWRRSEAKLQPGREPASKVATLSFLLQSSFHPRAEQMSCSRVALLEIEATPLLFRASLDFLQPFSMPCIKLVWKLSTARLPSGKWPLDLAALVLVDNNNGVFFIDQGSPVIVICCTMEWSHMPDEVVAYAQWRCRAAFDSLGPREVFISQMLCLA